MHSPLELDPAAMRRLGYQVVDRLVDRIAHLDQDVAWRGAPREALESRLREVAPETGRSFDDILDRLYTDVLAFTARVDHPRFLAFVPGCPTWPGILADFIAAGHNIFQGTWLGAAGPSALELVVLEWFRSWLGLPAPATGLLLSGGSAANLTALACARHAAPEPERAVVYVGAEVHSSVTKAARVVGFNGELYRVIPSDAAWRIDLTALERAIADDRSRGLVPAAVVASAGTTSTGAIDPLAAIADLARANRLWVHVDAAYGGFAVLTERCARLLRGIEHADSITLDPHKWLYQPFETGCLLVRDAAALERVFSSRASYLQDTRVAGAEVNFGERGIQLTRTARALKIWVSIQYFGLAAFRDTIDRCLDLVEYAERRIRASSSFQLLAPASLGIVCFRRVWNEYTEAELDAANADLVQQLASSGLALLSSTRVDGRNALRFCVLNYRTTERDIDQVLEWLERAAPGNSR